MKTYFDDNFAAHADGEFPDGWLVEQHADLFHKLGEVRGNAYWITFPGNKHLPMMPRLRDFTLRLRLKADDYSSALGLLVFFRYNQENRSGYCLRLHWDAQGLEIVWGLYRAGNYQTLAKSKIDEPVFPAGVSDGKHGAECELCLDVAGCVFKCRHNDRLVAQFTDEALAFDRSGVIAFDSPGLAGARNVFLCAVRVDSNEAVPETEIWPERRIEFPAHVNGMTTPFYYHLQAVCSDARFVLNVALTGGPRVGRAAIHELQARRNYWPNIKLSDPYLRLECPDGRVVGPFCLLRGVVGLKEHWNPHSSGFLAADRECPVYATIILPDLPQHAILVFGYEHYAAEDRLSLAGGPSEIFVRPLTGEIVYAGPALRPGDVLPEIVSPSDKKICALLPQDDLRCAQALDFAGYNHFFFESEPARFRIILRHRAKSLAGATLTANVQSENVFREPLGPPRNFVFEPVLDSDPAFMKDLFDLGTSILATEWFECPMLQVGVYHLAVVLGRNANGSSVASDAQQPRMALAGDKPDLAVFRKAFEIMADDPAAPSPPQASGLPDLIPYLDSFGTDAAMFDPWCGRGVNEAHYLATTHYQPLVARRDKIWDVVHLYRRKWMTDLAPYVIKQTDFTHNQDFLRHCDLIWIFERQDLWIQATYSREPARDVLRQFLRSPEFEAQAGQTLHSENFERENKLTDSMFAELINQHWKKWLAFYNRWNAETHLAGLRATLAQINPNSRMMCYGIYPPYGATYKSAYFPLLMGRDVRNGLEKFLDGPLIFEHYPYMSGYLLQRGVFMLAALKLEAPQLKYYPEIYGIAGFAGDSRPAYGRPPYGHFAGTPPGCIRKTIFEFVYGAVWFDRAGFHFWNDRGFNAQNWPPSHFDELLDTWRIVERNRPLKPLRAAAFCYSRTSCLQHPDRYEKYSGNTDFENNPYPPGDMINTAEEAVAFAYEQARKDGQQAGFVTGLEYLAHLAPEDAHTIVLPPLCGATAAELAAIRRLHEQGVALLGFEDVSGLEDLFGVEHLAHAEVVKAIYVPDVPHNPLRELSGQREQCAHDDCRAHYRPTNGIAWLTGVGGCNRAIPVLVANRTAWGQTALFTIAPTLVRRSDLKCLVAYGKESISSLVNSAAALVLRAIGRPVVDTTAGKLIAFEDQAGGLHVIIEEDAFPAPSLTIDPVLTILRPDLTGMELMCDKPVLVLERGAQALKIQLHLEPHESAHISLKGRC